MSADLSSLYQQAAGCNLVNLSCLCDTRYWQKWICSSRRHHTCFTGVPVQSLSLIREPKGPEGIHFYMETSNHYQVFILSKLIWPLPLNLLCKGILKRMVCCNNWYFAWIQMHNCVTHFSFTVAIKWAWSLSNGSKEVMITSNDMLLFWDAWWADHVSHCEVNSSIYLLS